MRLVGGLLFRVQREGIDGGEEDPPGTPCGTGEGRREEGRILEGTEDGRRTLLRHASRLRGCGLGVPLAARITAATF